jgi:hypothetical protein
MASPPAALDAGSRRRPCHRSIQTPIPHILSYLSSHQPPYQQCLHTNSTISTIDNTATTTNNNQHHIGHNNHQSCQQQKLQQQQLHSQPTGSPISTPPITPPTTPIVPPPPYTSRYNNTGTTAQSFPLQLPSSILNHLSQNQKSPVCDNTSPSDI